MTDTTSFLEENREMVHFVTVALIVYAVFYGLYEYFIVGTEVFFSYLEISTSLAAKLLAFMGEPYQINEKLGYLTEIRSLDVDAFVVVAKGCDGSVTFAVLISTIIAWRSTLLTKVIGLGLGIALMLTLNIGRIAGLFLVDVYLPLEFDLYHEWIFPTGLVMSALIYFNIWMHSTFVD